MRELCWRVAGGGRFLVGVRMHFTQMHMGRSVGSQVSILCGCMCEFENVIAEVSFSTCPGISRTYWSMWTSVL